MRPLINKILFIVPSLMLLLVHLLVPQVAFAATGCEKLEQSIGFAANNDSSFTSVLNMVPHVCQPGSLLSMVLNIMFAFAGAIAVMFIIIGGYRYMASGGNEEMASAGKKTLIYAIVGLVVVVLSTAIVNIVLDLIKQTPAA